MIIVFPMLVSRAVSENSIPGIAKTLENYIIVNYQDMIINNTDIKKQSSIFGKILYRKGNLLIKEDEDLLEGLPPEADPGTKNKKSYKQSDKQSDKTDTDQSKKLDSKETLKDKKKKLKDELKDLKTKKEKEEKEKLARNAKSDVRVSDTKSIALDPTYITIDRIDKRGNKTEAFIGVKVVPIRIKSDVKLSHLLLYDSQVKNLTAMSLRTGRKIMKLAYGLFDKWSRIFKISGLTPSGDPRRDIIMGRTGMGKGSETFIVLSKQEDVDEMFLDNIQRINRLFNMGWGNFVIADDIGRSAYFCMTKFKGMCNSIPYAMMYQYLGQTKAYETMEDAKKASSSIFKVGKRFSKVLGEWRTTNKLYKYSQLNEDDHNE